MFTVPHTSVILNWVVAKSPLRVLWEPPLLNLCQWKRVWRRQFFNYKSCQISGGKRLWGCVFCRVWQNALLKLKPGAIKLIGWLLVLFFLGFFCTVSPWHGKSLVNCLPEVKICKCICVRMSPITRPIPITSYSINYSVSPINNCKIKDIGALLYIRELSVAHVDTVHTCSLCIYLFYIGNIFRIY